MSFKIAKLPEPVNGLSKTSSETSVGMPKKLKMGESKLIKTFASPLALNSATAHSIATMYGRISMHSEKAPLAPSIKLL